MSASTACSASRLLWMSLMIAFTPGLMRGVADGETGEPLPLPNRENGPNKWRKTYLRSVLRCRKECQGTARRGKRGRLPVGCKLHLNCIVVISVISVKALCDDTR